MYIVIYPAGDRTNARRMQRRSSTTGPLVHCIAKLTSHGKWMTSEVIITWMHIFKLRTWPWRWLCPLNEYGCKKTHQVKWPRVYHEKLIWQHLCAMWTIDSVIEFRICFMDADSISRGARHFMHGRWDLIKLNQLSSVPVCRTQYVPNFPIIVIQFIIYKYI